MLLLMSMGSLVSEAVQRLQSSQPVEGVTIMVLAGGPALWFGWAWLDPVVSLLIAAVIVVGSWNLLKQSLHLLFDGVPESVDLHAVHSLLKSLPGVARLHYLHVWAMGTSEIALAAHLVMPEGGGDGFLAHATDELREYFDIRHVTIQITRTQSAV